MGKSGLLKVRFGFVVLIVAKSRFGLGLKNPECVVLHLLVLHKLSLIVGVGTTLGVALRFPHSKSFGSA